MTFLLKLNYPADVTFTPHWGTSSYYGTEDEHYINDTVEIDTKGGNVNENGITTYTVQEGDILSSIAPRFGTTVERIKVYNNLTSDSIQIDQMLLIPPEDWQMPETSDDVNSVSDQTNDEESSAAETTEDTKSVETKFTETTVADAETIVETETVIIIADTTFVETYETETYDETTSVTEVTLAETLSENSETTQSEQS